MYPVTNSPQGQETKTCTIAVTIETGQSRTSDMWRFASMTVERRTNDYSRHTGPQTSWDILQAFVNECVLADTGLVLQWGNPVPWT